MKTESVDYTERALAEHPDHEFKLPEIPRVMKPADTRYRRRMV